MNTLTPEQPATVETAAVTTASARDREAVLDVLVRAFQADPVIRWAFPDPRTYRDGFRAFAAAFGGRAFEHRSAFYAGEMRGAALWLPPGVGPDEEAMAPQLERDVPDDRLDDFYTVLGEAGRYHPEEPHWYLPLIGVDPAHKGIGHGSSLLRHVTERLDRAARVAYLESTNPLNLPLYRRHGFEVCGKITVGTCPPVYPMVRQPR